MNLLSKILLHTGGCAISLLLSIEIVAQPVIKVKDVENKQPLPGAHVHWINQENQIIQSFVTNRDGEVHLKDWKVETEQTFKIKFIGYQTKEIVIATDFKESIIYLQTESFQLDEAVVTGQFTKNNVSDAVQPITVISREKIESMGAVTLNDVLANELNIRLNQDNVLGSFMTMQGISGQNVKILMDGVPVIGRLDGNIDLSQINLQNIERIEVVKGPLSVNYGSDALAGTINLITKNGKHYKNSIHLGSYAETSGKLNVYGDFHYHHQKHIIQLSGGRNVFNGWNPYDTFWPDLSDPVADSTRFKQWKPRIQNFGDVSYTFKGKDYNIRINSRIFDETLISKGKPRQPYQETAFDEYFNTRRWDNDVIYNHRFKNHKNLQIIGAYNYFSRTRSTYFKDLTTLEQSLSELEGSQDTSVFDLINLRSTFSQTDPSKKIQYEVGIDVKQESSLGKRIQGQEQSIGDYAIFVSAEYLPFSSLKLRPGLRYAYNTQFKSPLVPSLNVMWNFHENWALRSSYVRGFRAPTLKELYFYFVDVNHNIVGNPNLDAEFSHNARLGVQFKKGLKKSALRINLTGFYNDINNMITLAQMDAVEFSYVNIGNFRTLGSELSVNYLFPNAKITGGVTYTGRDQGIDEIEGWKAFQFYPEFQLNASKTFQKWGMTLSGFFKYQGQLPGFAIIDDEITSTYINPYSLLDVTITKFFFGKRIQLTAGCKNLLNVRQVDAFGGQGGTHNSSASSVSIGMGRTLFLKLDWNINYGKLNQKKNE